MKETRMDSLSSQSGGTTNDETPSVQSQPLSTNSRRSSGSKRSYGLKAFKQTKSYDRGSNDKTFHFVNISFHDGHEGRESLPGRNAGTATAVAEKSHQVSGVNQASFETETVAQSEAILAAEQELISTAGCKAKFVADISPRYPCNGCLDVFPSQFSLDDHFNRKSYSVVLKCPGCSDKTLLYSNKCIMYNHLASHYTDLDIRVQIAQQHTHITPLPRSGSKDSKLNNTDAPDKNSSNMNNKTESSLRHRVEPVGPAGLLSSSLEKVEESDSKLTSLSSPVVKAEAFESSSSAMSVDGDSSVFENGTSEISVVCTECSAQFDNEMGLVGHFARVASSAGGATICAACNKRVLTSCSAKAHQRTHQMTEPFTCPDCGIRMYKKSVFLKHLRLLCLHFTKLYEFPCPTCSEIFKKGEDQLAHLKQNPNHLRYPGEKSYYKCNGCPKAFKSVAAHSKHKTCPGAGCSVVHMCNNCPEPAVFRSFLELQNHREGSHTDLKWTPKRALIYACYLCTHKSKFLAGFTDHLMKIHQKKPIHYMCNYCGVDTDTSDALEKHSVACIFKESFNQQSSDIVERVPKLSSTSSTEDSQIHNSMESSFVLPSNGTSSSALNRLQRNHSTSFFNCLICTAKFSTYGSLRDHVNSYHEGRGLIYDCWICKAKGVGHNFFRQKLLDKHLLDVHKIRIPSNEENGVDAVVVQDAPDASGEPPVKKLKVWGENTEYRCCRCNFSSNQLTEFKEHIKVHKVTPESVQCTDCGMCFSVQLALRRHLFAVHKVTDYAKYSRNQYMAEYEQQLNNTEGICPVCNKRFDKEALLRKHIRTHGMVYINTKRC